mmetsp:Transcript_36845/g.98116  ORF Transcript_36845/g.98116 Transcript_36845/m.98116 type:complete len:84 (-) Transcript_36845:60-311(-)
MSSARPAPRERVRMQPRCPWRLEEFTQCTPWRQSLAHKVPSGGGADTVARSNQLTKSSCDAHSALCFAPARSPGQSSQHVPQM